ncbi:hypothetical protein PHJA_000385100, partial [Phtheirospermum japonicum]
CLGKVDNIENVTFTPTTTTPNLFTSGQSELDQFMEAYCVALNKLKEVIEEPQQESMAFINYMYSQLEELLLADISPSSTICKNTMIHFKVMDMHVVCMSVNWCM